MADLKLLIFLQICIDAGIVIAFIFFIKRLKTRNEDSPVKDGLKIFESVLADAEKTAAQFNRQLEEKNQLIHKLSRQLDQKIMSINVLLNRADAMLAGRSPAGTPLEKPLVSNRQGEEIIRLAKEGRDLDTIAETLSIPKEEVRLVLDLNKKIARLSREEGAA